MVERRRDTEEMCGRACCSAEGKDSLIWRKVDKDFGDRQKQLEILERVTSSFEDFEESRQQRLIFWRKSLGSLRRTSGTLEEAVLRRSRVSR
ncbi:hypothetical protein CEXT_433921 [Caerostris extrusa]|uniref:Uncharacterized protein n=1 Tax=Caerostris extrusa TaxID=172846 RepID=A0AAV4WAX2_CAEEX|nr:hypothetical protein CEXT_433921 [Caerostris extrusa]